MALERPELWGAGSYGRRRRLKNQRSLRDGCRFVGMMEDAFVFFRSFNKELQRFLKTIGGPRVSYDIDDDRNSHLGKLNFAWSFFKTFPSKPE